MTEVATEPVAAPQAPATTQTERAADLRARALRGSSWTVVGFGLGQAIRFGANLVLARLLFPEAFGTMAIINAMILGLHLFSDVGVAPAIVQNRRGDDPAFLNTAWTIQCGRGTLLWVVACALAYPMASFYDDPRLAVLIPVAALSAILDGLCSTKLIALQRHLSLGRATAIEVGAQAAAAVVMIAWALLSPSLWALVGGTLAGPVVRTAVSHALPGPRNRLSFDRAIAHELFHFGKWIFASTLLTFLAEYCDRLWLGKLISRDELGVYNIALMIAVIPTQVVGRLGSAVFFPSFSRALEQRAGFRSGFQSARTAMALAGGFLVAGMLGTGQAVIEMLYDERYHAAGWMLQILAGGAWYLILECAAGAALLALGDVRWLATANFAKVVTLAATVPLGFHYAGLPGALAALALASVAKYLVSATAVRRHGFSVLARDARLTLWVALSGSAVCAISEGLRKLGLPMPLVVLTAVSAVTALWAKPLVGLRRVSSPR